MATQNLTYVIDCESIPKHGTLGNPGGANHYPGNEQVVLYVNNVPQSDVQVQVPISVGDDVRMTAVHRSNQDDYRCAIVRFMAITWRGETVTPAMMLDQNQRPIDEPQFDSQSLQGFGLQYKPAQPAWENDPLIQGVMITNDAQVQQGILRFPYVKFETQNKGLLQYRIEFVVAYKGQIQGYNWFDPYLNIQ